MTEKPTEETELLEASQSPIDIDERNKTYHYKRQKIREIRSCLDRLEGTDCLLTRNMHLAHLRRLCRERYGLINKDLRKRAWPQLLNIAHLMEQEGTTARRRVPSLPLTEETEWQGKCHTIVDLLRVYQDECRQLSD